MHSRTCLSASCLSVIVGLTGGCVERLLTDGFREEAAGEPCENDLDCGEGYNCYAGTCVGAGELRVSLSWMETTDLDLHVLTPTGIEISYLTPSHSFGHLDVDDCVAGNCRSPAGPHVENVVLEPSAPRGHYQVWIENFDGRRAAIWEVEVAGDVANRWHGELSGVQGEQSDVMDVFWP